MHLPIPLLRASKRRFRAALIRPGLWAAAALGLGLAQPAWAEPSAWTPQGLFVQAGRGDRVDALTAGLTWPWSRTWNLLGGQLGGYWEASLSRWQVDDAAASQRHFNQWAVTPVFRWRPAAGASPWFFEGAVGLTYLDGRYENHGKVFSTRFNFGDHVALGRSFGAAQRHELALRFQHFSNGSLRRPNPGEDFWQLRYALRFE